MTHTIEHTEEKKSPASFDMRGKSLGDLEHFFGELGEPAYRAKQAFRRINKHLARSLDEFSEFPLSLRESLKELNALPATNIEDSSLSRDGTEKVIFDGGVKGKNRNSIKVETVWLLSSKRKTICVSSQAGCTYNCSFCATGTLPFRGNLSSAQIIEQIYGIIRHRGELPSNIVFMGMGEPLQNYENVMKAAHILHHPEGLGMSARHITISTAGVIPGIDRMIADKSPFNLAVSLNQADSKKRAEIMDIEKRFPLERLINSVKRFVRYSNRAVTFEYVMIPGVNMSHSDARNLIILAKSVKCKVNLIPLNTEFNGWSPPTDSEVDKFQQKLLDANLFVFNRGSSGRDINGACGMLALKKSN